MAATLRCGREVLPAGVAHVMKTFFRHFAGEGEAPVNSERPARLIAGEIHRAEMQRVIDVLCDEEAINNT